MFQSLGIIQEHDDDPLLGRYFRVSTILFRPLSRSIIQAAHSIGARLFSCICACSGHGSDIAALARTSYFVLSATIPLSARHGARIMTLMSHQTEQNTPCACSLLPQKSCQENTALYCALCCLSALSPRLLRASAPLCSLLRSSSSTF